MFPRMEYRVFSSEASQTLTDAPATHPKLPMPATQCSAAEPAAVDGENRAVEVVGGGGGEEEAAAGDVGGGTPAALGDAGEDGGVAGFVGAECGGEEPPGRPSGRDQHERFGACRARIAE